MTIKFSSTGLKRNSWDTYQDKKQQMLPSFLAMCCRIYIFCYFGHIKRHETLERHILEARIDGRRGRGRPTRRWEQDINDWMDMTTTQAGRLAEDRILFRQKVQEATSRQEIS